MTPLIASLEPGECDTSVLTYCGWLGAGTAGAMETGFRVTGDTSRHYHHHQPAPDIMIPAPTC